jgi:hypothetical protein
MATRVNPSDCGSGSNWLRAYKIAEVFTNVKSVIQFALLGQRAAKRGQSGNKPLLAVVITDVCGSPARTGLCGGRSPNGRSYRDFLRLPRCPAVAVMAEVPHACHSRVATWFERAFSAGPVHLYRESIAKRPYMRHTDGEHFQVFAINCAHVGCQVRWALRSAGYSNDHSILDGNIEAGATPKPGFSASNIAKRPPCT